MTSNLKIIKARVEQDKYASVELKIIKADGDKILKDLYVEKEINDGEFYVVSDNVLVALHRTLRNGDIANLSLMDSNGNMLTESIFSKIENFDSLFVCVKSSSNMISVKNNQNLMKDALKVQEIAEDSRNIKEQMNEFITKNNKDASVKYIFDDAYNEASIYNIVKDGDNYNVTLVADKTSFAAFDGVNLYSHSNIVTDVTKSETIVFPTIKEASNSITHIDPPIATPSTEKEEIKEEEKEETKKEEHEEVSEKVKQPTQSFFRKFAPKKLEEVKEIVKEEDSSINNREEVNKTFDKFFGLSNTEEVKDSSNEVDNNDLEEVKKETKEESEEVNNEKTQSTFDLGENDDLDKLSELITKLINKGKESTATINKLNSDIEALNIKVEKLNIEIENKTKKVNALINDNRKYMDENRVLKENISKLEDENNKYLEENKKLKEEALNGRNKINAVISSIDEVLNSYDEKQLVKKG